MSKLGRPDSVTYANYPTVGRRLEHLYYRNVTVRMGPDGLKRGLAISRRGPATRRGLRVGDTTARARALYGRPPGQSSSEWRYDIEGDEYGPELILWIRNGRIARIYVGYDADGSALGAPR